MGRTVKNPPKPLEISISPLGPRLAALRKTRGFTQQALAEVMGITQKQMTDYETGRVIMNAEMVIRFSLALKVSADTLLGLADFDLPEEAPNIRFTKRLRDLELLPEQKKRAIIKILDEFTRPQS